jgi:hypothetical protein
MKALVLSVALAAGCSGSLDGMAGAGDSCSTTEHCAPPLVCISMVCRDPASDADIGDAGPRPDAAIGCGEFDFNVSNQPADLVLVVDRSRSMEDEIAGRQTKWEALLEAVDGVTGALEATIDFGLATYPASGSGGLSCDAGSVLIDPATNNASAIMTRLTRDGTTGATPTASTLEAVGSYFDTPRAGHEAHTSAIVLATDGAPNCNDELSPSSCTCSTMMGGGCSDARFCLDDTRTYAAIDAIRARTPAIPVYVIGLPGTEAFGSVLSEMARRGGTARAGDPPYYAAGDAMALQEALAEIAAGLVSCTFHMEVVPENPRNVRIIVDGMEVPHTDDRSEGWAYTDGTNSTIELFGMWCDRLSDGGAHEVTAQYACSALF